MLIMGMPCVAMRLGGGVVAPKPVEVNTGSLADTATHLHSLGASIRGIEAPAFGAIGNSLAGFETASAAARVDGSVKQALTTIAGRHEQFGDALESASIAIINADYVAARLLESLGDLNQRPE
ncbi:hypothetical protein GORBP_122_00260 [Gordonia rubripertincta NBRC 101908]|uniref:PE domain-containing protein n=1 Tax=Gordonia rubripertincta NBRC 101908 TaxID=1077975 RepID=A0ABQ0I0A8_GORRU|nr:hypothetical protein GORBP_122_00260 [Gordonia rubripertincta NBRC 101908]